MKKFTTLALGMLAGIGFAGAQTLGTATLVEPTGEYVLDLGTIQISWYNGTESTPLEFVDPQYDEYDENQEYPFAYVDFYVPGSTEAVQAKAEIQVGGEINLPLGGTVVIPNGLTINVSDLVELDYTTWTPVAGEYKIEVPANTVKVAGGTEENDLVSFDIDVLPVKLDKPYTVPYINDDLYYDSAESYSSEDLANLQVIWNGGTIKVVALGGEYENEIILMKEDIFDPIASFGIDDITYNEDKTGLVFDLSTYEAGSYCLQVPSRFVMVNDEYIANGSQYFYFNIFNGMANAEIISPADNYVSFIEDVTITWDFQNVSAVDELTATLQINPTMFGETIEVPASAFRFVEVQGGSDEPGEPDTDEPSEPVPTAETDDVENQGNALIINIAELIEQLGGYGDFALTIPTGIVKNENGELNPKQTFNFHYFPTYENQASIALTEDGMMTINWRGVSTVSQTIEVSAALEPKDEINPEPIIINSALITSSGSVVTIDLAGLNLQNGEYTLVLPNAFVKLNMESENEDGEYVSTTYFNAAQTYTFEIMDGTTTDVKGLNAEEFDGVYRVYNLQGVKVMETTDAAALRNLNGLYIINGKKAILK